MVTTQTYDKLNRLQTISSRAYAVGGSPATTLPLSTTYTYNSSNQRRMAHASDGSYWVYEYDALGQVTSGRRFWADGTQVAGQQFVYAFDDIGNRKSTGGRASAVSTYTRDYQNKYSQRTAAGAVDILGIANPTASVTVNNVAATRKGEYFHRAVSVVNTGGAQYPTIGVTSTYGATESNPVNEEVFVPPSTESFTYDADGNLISDGRWTYLWDGENRLVEMYRDTSTPTLTSRLRLVFEYDYLGRRIRKTFYTHSGTAWVLDTDTKFLYDRWNIVAELNGSNVKQRTFIWGLDLSGSRHAAGGVGGLLKMTDHTTVPATHHYVGYDGNGNVLSLTSGTTGANTARYEYGPFGETIRVTGTMAKKNPFRFSTKFTDNESGLVCYGYRYYAPLIGRWLNRDPIGEAGGIPQYGLLSNDGVNSVDLLGLRDCDDIQNAILRLKGHIYKSMEAMHDVNAMFDKSKTSAGISLGISGTFAAQSFVGLTKGLFANAAKATPVATGAMKGTLPVGIYTTSGRVAVAGTFEFSVASYTAQAARNTGASVIGAKEAGGALAEEGAQSLSKKIQRVLDPYGTLSEFQNELGTTMSMDTYETLRQMQSTLRKLMSEYEVECCKNAKQ